MEHTDHSLAESGVIRILCESNVLLYGLVVAGYEGLKWFVLFLQKKKKMQVS